MDTFRDFTPIPPVSPGAALVIRTSFAKTVQLLEAQISPGFVIDEVIVETQNGKRPYGVKDGKKEWEGEIVLGGQHVDIHARCVAEEEKPMRGGWFVREEGQAEAAPLPPDVLGPPRANGNGNGNGVHANVPTYQNVNGTMGSGHMPQTYSPSTQPQVKTNAIVSVGDNEVAVLMQREQAKHLLQLARGAVLHPAMMPPIERALKTALGEI